MGIVSYTILFIIAGVLKNTCSLQVIPERSAILYVNEKYVTDVKLYIRRFNRRSNYFLNVEGTIKHTWANNVSAHCVFYEYLHNEYKRSFVEMHFKLCDMFNDPYIGKALANVGAKCPTPPGPFNVNNVTIPAHDFPNVWPFERCKVDIKFKRVVNEELLANIEVYLQMKQKIG